MMKIIKKELPAVILCFFEILIGILLLVDPVSFTSAIIVTVGSVLSVIGIINIIRYFRTDIVVAAQKQILFKGLVCLLSGGFCILNSYWFIATFPILTIIYGIAILLAGLRKVQWVVNMIRLRHKKWYLAAIGALVSIACAVIILSSPFTSTKVLWNFTGVSLIIEAVIDIVTLIISNMHKELLNDD